MHPALTYSPQTKQDVVKTPFLYPANPNWLCNDRIIVEVGPGRGDFLFHLADTNPDASVVGIEIKRKRVDKLITRVEKRALANVTIIQDDARAAIPRVFPRGSVDEIHINFPDPWPKNRHAKNRALSMKFLIDCVDALKVGGTISFTTDHRPYAEDVAAEASQIPTIRSAYALPIVTDMPEAYETFFAAKWRSEGRTINYQKYCKVG